MHTIRINNWYLTPWLIATTAGIFVGTLMAGAAVGPMASASVPLWILTFWLAGSPTGAAVFLFYGLLTQPPRRTSSIHSKISDGPRAPLWQRDQRPADGRRRDAA